jgi:hypothetical protein
MIPLHQTKQSSASNLSRSWVFQLFHQLLGSIRTTFYKCAAIRVSMKSKDNKNKESFLDTSKADLTNDILDIQDKPDVAVWNKKVLMQGENKGKVKIGSLDQNLIREDTGVPIDSANKESVADAVGSSAKMTDRVDFSKADSKNKK